MKEFAVWNNGEVVGYAEMTEETADQLNTIQGGAVYYRIASSDELLVKQFEAVLKQATKEIKGVEWIDGGTVEITYRGGHIQKVNILGNSKLAIIKDVAKSIKY